VLFASLIRGSHSRPSVLSLNPSNHINSHLKTEIPPFSVSLLVLKSMDPYHNSTSSDLSFSQIIFMIISHSLLFFQQKLTSKQHLTSSHQTIPQLSLPSNSNPLPDPEIQYPQTLNNMIPQKHNFPSHHHRPNPPSICRNQKTYSHLIKLLYFLSSFP